VDHNQEDALHLVDEWRTAPVIIIDEAQHPQAVTRIQRSRSGRRTVDTPAEEWHRRTFTAMPVSPRG
jgi:hypothetical protein